MRSRLLSIPRIATGFALLLLAVAPLWAQDVAPAAAKPTFDLMELRVLGNSVLEVRDVERVLIPHLGPGRTLDDVEAARGELEALYHAQGYGTVFVDIPEQSVGDDGVVRLRVTESKLRVARVSGAKYFSQRQIRSAVPAAAPDTVPKLPELQAQIGAVNVATADRSVVPVLKAGPVPGTVDLDLRVSDALPLHAVVEVNDQYTADTTRLRSSIGLSYDNLWGRQDSIALQYQFSPEDRSEVSVYAASYTARLGGTAGQVGKLTLTYINSQSEIATVGDINVTGAGKTYSARYQHPVTFTAELQSNAILGLDYKQSAQDVRLSDADGLSTPVDYASLQAGYGFVARGDTRTWNGTGHDRDRPLGPRQLAAGVRGQVLPLPAELQRVPLRRRRAADAAVGPRDRRADRRPVRGRSAHQQRTDAAGRCPFGARLSRSRGARRHRRARQPRAARREARPRVARLQAGPLSLL